MSQKRTVHRRRNSPESSTRFPCVIVWNSVLLARYKKNGRRLRSSLRVHQLPGSGELPEGSGRVDIYRSGAFPDLLGFYGFVTGVLDSWPSGVGQERNHDAVCRWCARARTGGHSE